MTANILVGTASWTDKTLIACGRFYPPGCTTAEQRLRFYAGAFPLVEVDSSYYGIPTPRNAQLWAERTPADFTFNVKAFRLFTGHPAPVDVLPRDIQQALGSRRATELPALRGAGMAGELREADLPRELADDLWRRFIEALAPLRAAGKLGAVHFQFAPWVRCDRAGIALVERCVQRMPGHLLAAEFRHRSWFDSDRTDRTLAFLRRLGLVHTVVDAPQGFANTVPCVWDTTHPDLALLRLHGRNSRMWNAKGLAASSSRFDYQYSGDELAAMLPEIRQLATQARRVHVIFNTNNADQGQRGAQMLARLLQVNLR